MILLVFFTEDMMKFKKILTGFAAALMLSGAIGAPVTAKATTHFGGWRTHQKIARVAQVN